jgi:hypothetical protein
MRTFLAGLAVITLAAVGPGTARAADPSGLADQPAQLTPPPPPPPPQQPQQPIAVVPESAPPATPSPAAYGQWVFTSQYGWVYMPWSDQYTSLPPDDYGDPYQYVYEPTIGWTWVAAPWIWGWGPWPYFGPFGPARFGWWGHRGWHRPWPGTFPQRPWMARGGVPLHQAAPVRAPPPIRSGSPSHGGARPGR